MLPVKVEPPLMEMEEFPPIVYWAWPEFSKEPPMMSPVKVIPSLPMMETEVSPLMLLTVPALFTLPYCRQ